MIKVFLMVLFLIVIFTGIGSFTLKKLKIDKTSFSAPVGFVIFIAILQMCYYPVQLTNGSFNWIIVISSLLLIAGLILTIISWKEVLQNLFRIDSLIVLASVIGFCFVFYHLFIDIEFSDAPMYLNYISQNINNSNLNLFNLYTGLVGAEWDGLYLYQGYYHFASFLCWFINIPYYIFGNVGYIENIAVSTWGLGTLYSVISSMFIVEIVRYFKLKNKWFEICLLIFTLLFSNFYYWRVAFSFYGNTFRTLLITILIFTIYRWLKESNEKIKYLIPFIVGASLACSSTSLFISFIVLYSLAAYLFLIKKEKAFYDMSTFVIPLAVYTTVMLGKSSIIIGAILAIIFIAYYILRYIKFFKKIINNVQSFFFDYAKVIFFIVVPVAFALLSAYINIFKPDFLINYAYYFQDHQKYDMVKDYSFRFSGVLDNILNVIRWLGVILILFKASSKEDKFIKTLFFMMIVLFMNPLCTTAVAYTMASNVFYRSIEILFNPFTELLMILYVYKIFEWHKIGQWILEFILIGAVIFGHYFSWNNNRLEGLYTVYLNGGKEVDPILKLKDDEIQVIRYLKQVIQDNSIEGQPVIVSQANGLRTFIPDAYQLITARDWYYPHTRLNEEFYEIARYHYNWQPEVKTNYEDSCKYLKEYDVDYIIVQYKDNYKFDIASDACTTLYMKNSKYKVKIVNK